MKTLKSIKQKEIYEFIKSQIGTKGYPPTIREICKTVGLTSTATVYAHLKRLEKNGSIKRNPISSRSIEIIKNSSNRKEMIDISVINNIDDINSILSPENIKETFPLPSNFIESHNELLLNMKHKPHDCRHTFATLMNNADANPTSIKKLIGHNSFTTTEKIYTHKDIEELRKAIELI
ncbi:LexA family protein [Clostridium fermenticellae]|nr:tyrosine-type recombinase/integrase [Clostridium fermenticellae]